MDNTIVIVLGVILAIASILVFVWASGLGNSNAAIISDYKGGKLKLKLKKLKKH